VGECSGGVRWSVTVPVTRPRERQRLEVRRVELIFRKKTRPTTRAMVMGMVMMTIIVCGDGDGNGNGNRDRDDDNTTDDAF
jgi:hypothetical protein